MTHFMSIRVTKLVYTVSLHTVTLWQPKPFGYSGLCKDVIIFILGSIMAVSTLDKGVRFRVFQKFEFTVFLTILDFSEIRRHALFLE